MAVDITPSNVVIEQIDINLLKPHPRNVEIYGDEDVMELQQSIAESGWIKPLTVTPEYVIVGGHRRFRAAKAEGYKKLPVVIEVFPTEEALMERLLRENENRGKTPEQQIREGMTWEDVEKGKGRHGGDRKSEGFSSEKIFPLDDGRVSDIIARRVGLGSGKTYEKGKDVVVRIDDELKTGDYHRYAEILRTQLNEQSITSAWNTLDKIEKAEEKERLDRDREEEKARLKAQQLEEELKKVETMPDRGITPGSWWKLGHHRIYCGDSSSDEFKNRLKDAQASFAFADPPYNAGVDEWDINFEWKHDYLTEVAPVVAVTPGISAIDAFMNKKKMPYYKWSMSYWINNGMTRGALGFGNWMYVALFSNESLYRNEQDLERIDLNEQWDQDKEAISISGGDQDPLKHKGRKPINLMKHIIEMFTTREETVIDPFLGTGTTLIACELTGRVCVGAELSVEYCESIIKRWEAVSGQQAEGGF
jgi:ParB family chromosome partitioning protein